MPSDWGPFTWIKKWPTKEKWADSLHKLRLKHRCNSDGEANTPKEYCVFVFGVTAPPSGPGPPHS